MSEGRKSLLLVLIFALIIGGWSVFYNYTYNKNIDEFAADNLSNRQIIQQIEQQIIKEQETRDSIVEDYYLSIPNVSGLANLHDLVYDVASKNNLELSSITFNVLSSDVPTDISNVDIHFSVIGKYLDVRSFLQDVYNSKRLLKLVEWNWGGSEEGILSMDLVYNSFFYPNEYDEFIELPKIDVYDAVDRINPIE